MKIRAINIFFYTVLFFSFCSCHKEQIPQEYHFEASLEESSSKSLISTSGKVSWEVGDRIEFRYFSKDLKQIKDGCKVVTLTDDMLNFKRNVAKFNLEVLDGTSKIVATYPASSHLCNYKIEKDFLLTRSLAYIFTQIGRKYSNFFSEIKDSTIELNVRHIIEDPTKVHQAVALLSVGENRFNFKNVNALIEFQTCYSHAEWALFYHSGMMPSKICVNPKDGTVTSSTTDKINWALCKLDENGRCLIPVPGGVNEFSNDSVHIRVFNDRYEEIETCNKVFFSEKQNFSRKKLVTLDKFDEIVTHLYPHDVLPGRFEPSKGNDYDYNLFSSLERSIQNEVNGRQCMQFSRANLVFYKEEYDEEKQKYGQRGFRFEEKQYHHADSNFASGSHSDIDKLYPYTRYNLFCSGSLQFTTTNFGKKVQAIPVAYIKKYGGYEYEDSTYNGMLASINYESQLDSTEQCQLIGQFSDNLGDCFYNNYLKYPTTEVSYKTIAGARHWFLPMAEDFNKIVKSSNFAKAKIIDETNTIPGIVVVPPDFKDPKKGGVNANEALVKGHELNETTNVYSAKDWDNYMEPAGAVFLPMTQYGGRNPRDSKKIFFTKDKYCYYRTANFYYRGADTSWFSPLPVGIWDPKTEKLSVKCDKSGGFGCDIFDDKGIKGKICIAQTTNWVRHPVRLVTYYLEGEDN